MAGRPDAFAPMQRNTLRQYCRNPRCGSKLPQPMGNVHAAFCTRGCWQQFHRHRCVVCERRLMHRQPLRRGGSRAPTQRDCPDIPEFLRRTAQQPLQPSPSLVPADVIIAAWDAATPEEKTEFHLLRRYQIVSEWDRWAGEPGEFAKVEKMSADELRAFIRGEAAK